jgi:predicted nucleic acid-binding protein
MTDVLLDTNIIIRHLQDGFISSAPDGMLFFVSTITEAEALRFAGMGERETRLIERVLGLCVPIPVDSQIARLAAQLGRTRKIKLPDLLIAATALRRRIPLITLNARDFRGMTGLDVRNSF